MADPPLFASSAPVVKVEGTRQPDLARDLLRLEVEESTDGLKTLALHLIASAPRNQQSTDVVEYLDGTVIDFGKHIEVSLGPPGNEKIVFAGVMSSIEVGFDEGDVPHVSLTAEDELMRLRMTQRTKTYKRMSDADIARAIAGEHGLTALVDAAGPTYDVVQQVNESDLAFLRSRAERIAAELWVDAGTLHFATRDKRTGTTVTLTRGSQLVAVEARADLAHQCSAVTVSGYDASARKSIDVEAPSSTLEEEASGGKTGPQTLDRAYGALPGRRARLVPVNEEEARAYAKAELLRRARRFVTARGTTSCTPELVVGSRVTLARCGRPFDGPGYYVSRVQHTFDQAKGHRTLFTAERATVTS